MDLILTLRDESLSGMETSEFAKRSLTNRAEADRESPYYPAFYEFNQSIRSRAHWRQPRKLSGPLEGQSAHGGRRLAEKSSWPSMSNSCST